jgi:hypothetical protein
MKQVYHIRIAMGPSDSGETASERIYQTLHSMGDFIKEKIDNNAKGFFFEGIGYSSTSLANKSIDDADFKDYLNEKLNAIADVEELVESDEIRTSFILDAGYMEVWKYEFLELSEVIEKTITVFGDYSEHADIVYQMYDVGDYDTGIVAVDMELFEGVSASSYLKSESPDNFPPDEIFQLDTYKI